MKWKQVLAKFGLREPHGRIELYLLRIGFAVVIVRHFPLQPDFPDQPIPHGLAQYLDLTIFSAQVGFWPIYVGLAIALLYYCLGRWMFFATGYMLVMTVGAGTLYNSQGDIHHNTQIVSLVLLGQFLAYSWGTMSRLIRRPLRLPDGCRIHDLAVYFSYQMIASVYVAAGISKVVSTVGLWAWTSPGFAVEVIKTTTQFHYSFWDPSVLSSGASMAEWILANPWFVRILFAGALCIELLAFFALLNRRARFIVGMLLIALHQGIYSMTRIEFSEPQLLILIFFLSIPFWIEQLIFRRNISESQAVTRVLSENLDSLSRLQKFVGWLPGKLMLFVIVLSLWVQEWYPFSSFPMYSRFDNAAYYVYVTDGGNTPLPLVSNFGIKAASLKKIHRSYKTEALNSDSIKEKASAEQKAAHTLLSRLRFRQNARGIETVYGLKLWQVDLRLIDGKIVSEGPRLLGEASAEDL